jgi:hypothetical protein
VLLWEEPQFQTAGVAQLVEHLICNQRVVGSNPIASSKKQFRKQDILRGVVAA